MAAADATKGNDEGLLGEVASTAEYEPLVKLEKVETVSGEEGEDVLYLHRARAYRFRDGEWKQRGTGDARFLQDRATGKIRLLMRQEKTLKVCLNQALLPGNELKLNGGSDRTYAWAAPDFSEDEVCHDSFGLKFKTREIAETFKKFWDEYSAINGAIAKGEKPAKATRMAGLDEAKGAAGGSSSSGGAAEKKDGGNDPSTWAKILKERNFSPLTAENIKTLWKKYDADDSGSMDAGELTKLIEDLMEAVLATLGGEKLDDKTRSQIKDEAPTLAGQALKKLDVNKDGHLSFEEFKKLNDVTLAMAS